MNSCMKTMVAHSHGILYRIYGISERVNYG